MTMNHVIQRRSFICNAGAALSATVAATAVAEGIPTKQPSPDAKDEIRQLHQDFVERLNGRRYAELGKLFAGLADPAGTHDSRPRAENFERPLPESTQHPVLDYITGYAQHLDTIEVAPDQQHATARFHCLTRLEAALSATIPLVEMARQQGQGAIQWWESGVLENTYLRLASGWKIRRLAFRATGPWRLQL
jgi:hypothetical protein